MFVNDAVRASLPARRPLPSACAPARHNRGQSQLLYYYYHYRDYDDNYYVCYYYYYHVHCMLIHLHGVAGCGQGLE